MSSNDVSQKRKRIWSWVTTSKLGLLRHQLALRQSVDWIVSGEFRVLFLCAERFSCTSLGQ